MSRRIIPESEFIINPDGSAFHLHVKPEELSPKIVMMGDPDRVTVAASLFDEIEVDVRSREFHTVTGTYKGKRVTALSHGIGTDNIDIVLTELDALANIDFNTREVKKEFTQLTMVAWARRAVCSRTARSAPTWSPKSRSGSTGCCTTTRAPKKCVKWCSKRPSSGTSTGRLSTARPTW